MSDANRRTSAMAEVGRGRNNRQTAGDAPKKDMWMSMLDGVASGKRLPEKNILVLGGTPDSQKDFMEGLTIDPVTRRPLDRDLRRPPVANQFALGYTYHDVLDTDHEDTLARVSLYLLTDPSPAFAPLLQPLLTPQFVSNSLIVILLDWSQPWTWLRQLRDWIRMLRTLLVSADEDCKLAMEESMLSWRDRGRGGGGLDGGGGGPSQDGSVVLPLGPGEWEEALGLPLCVVCQNADKIETLEKERGWREEEFDFVLQFLRTVLLKHGASLIYTSGTSPSSLQPLIHSSLGIQSRLRRQPLKHNVVDRDKVLVPPNWDSWGKIRVLREGFDVEGVNKGWTIDIESTHEKLPPTVAKADAPPQMPEESDKPAEGGALQVFEDTIRDPQMDKSLDLPKQENGTKLEVESVSTQTFLTEQLAIIDQMKAEEELQGKTKEPGSRNPSIVDRMPIQTDSIFGVGNGGRVNEHIGPVQFNMGGIQVDADDMLKRLKDREATRTPEREHTPAVSSPDSKSQNEQLASFFAGLMKRGTTSAANSPRSGAPAI